MTATLTVPTRTEPVSLPDTLTVEVNRLDIMFGIRNSGNQCPIAQAALRTLEQMGTSVRSVDVTSDDAGLLCEEPSWNWVLYSHDARAFISDFDCGAKVAPRTVVLRRMS